MTDGAALAQAYAQEVVDPLVDAAFPRLRRSTARLGTGSDVLGLDDAVSRDHDWGLRLTLVVPEDAVAAVDALLSSRLPAGFRDHPVRFATTWDGEVRHRVEVCSAADLLRSRTGMDLAHPPRLVDPLAMTGQAALELTAGPVLRDDDGVLARLRDRVAMPADVRRWAVASAWDRLEQELPFVGRTGDRGDEAGSRVIAARLAATAMRLGFLLEGRWAPYAKWLGTAFAALPRAGALTLLLERAVAAGSWREREEALATAIDALADLQAGAGLPSLRPATAQFWNRPFRGVRGLAATTLEAVEDAVLRGVPLVGTPDLWSDDVRLLVDHGLRRRMTAALLLPGRPSDTASVGTGGLPPDGGIP